MIDFYLVTALAWLTVSTSAKHLSDGFDRYLADTNVRLNSEGSEANPSDCCDSGECIDYRGTKSRTISGAWCQRWDQDHPQKNNWNPDRAPDAGLEANYCRNPSNWDEGLWCYVMDEGADPPYQKCEDPCQGKVTAEPKIVDSGKPACHADCKDPGSEPDCGENKTAYLVIKDETCLCSEWTCIWRSCEEVPFDSNNPIECDDTCTVPKKMDDCGCPTWKCMPLDCDAPINSPIQTCDSECEFVNTTARCGCNEYKCDAIKPQEKDACANDDDCGNCQACVTEPFISEECSAKTGYKTSHCGRKKCEPPKTCSACEEAKMSLDNCDCEQVECVPKTIQDNCGNCTACEECVLTEDTTCPGTGIQSCQPKACSADETPSCNVCQDLVTETDECNCGKSSCQWKKESIECEKDSDCSEGCDKICHKESICQIGSRKIRKHECRNGNITAPPKCSLCEFLKLEEEDSCGRSRYTCAKRECEDKKPKCEGECERPLVSGEDACGCPTYTCGKRMNSTEPRKPASCDENCGPCMECNWIKDQQCGDWKEGCTRNCLPIKLPRNPHCFESITTNNCGCDMPPYPLPCKELPKGPCEEGSNPLEVKDACGCDQRVCLPCEKEFEPSSCNECQTPVILSEIGYCRKGQCVQRQCPSPENVTCGECEELKAEEDKCGCVTLTCAPKTCTPPVPCKEDEELSGTWTRCGCTENICSKVCKEPQTCTKETCTTKVCEECG